MQYVYVLNQHREPLMPCSPRKARVLLREGKAQVVRRTPFTIQLLHGSSWYKQPVTLGVDAGSKFIGLSATTEKRELYREELQPRNDVVKLLSARRQFRRSRRVRKTRHRAPYIMRDVIHALAEKAPDAQNVVVTLEGPHGPVKANYPANCLDWGMAQTGNLPIWNIKPCKARWTVLDQMSTGKQRVNAITVDRIRKISYRGKTVYTKAE